MTALDLDEIRPALVDLYAALDAEVARAGPVCAVSGRCCRFAAYGHTLFVSAVEFDLLLADAPPPVRPLDEGRTCPWQDHRGHCTARSARPLGCRVYFCDPSYQETAQTLSEASLGRLKQFVAARDLPWNYAPLHHHLEAAHAAGRLIIAESTSIQT